MWGSWAFKGRQKRLDGRKKNIKTRREEEVEIFSKVVKFNSFVDDFCFILRTVKKRTPNKAIQKNEKGGYPN